MKIAVIVLNYNGWENTLECVESLKNARNSKVGMEIIVVDNNSTDSSKQHLNNIQDITLIQNEDNLGYSGGNNVGIKYALDKNFDFVLLINNDTYVGKNFFRGLYQGLEIADILSPKIYFAPGYEFHKSRYHKTDLGNVIWFSGGKIDWQNVMGFHMGVDEIDNGQFAESREIDFATGACMLVKTKVFKRIGLLDEKYFLYLEDMDFCVRAKKAGFSIVFFPKATLWHKNAASVGGSGSSLQDYYITRNRLLFAFKFASLKTKLAVLKQTMLQTNARPKRLALFDFLTLRFGRTHAKII